MKSKYTLRQRAIIPFIISSGMVVSGVRSIYKGMLLHQPWRIALASVGVVCFTTMMIMLIITVTKKEKAEAKA